MLALKRQMDVKVGSLEKTPLSFKRKEADVCLIKSLGGLDGTQVQLIHRFTEAGP